MGQPSAATLYDGEGCGSAEILFERPSMARNEQDLTSIRIWLEQGERLSIFDTNQRGRRTA